MVYVYDVVDKLRGFEEYDDQDALAELHAYASAVTFWSPDGLGEAVLLTLPVNTPEVWLPENLLLISLSFVDVPLAERVRLVDADGLGEADIFMLPVNTPGVWLPGDLLSVSPSFVDVLLAERVRLVDATSLRSFSVCEPAEVDVACSNPAIM